MVFHSKCHSINAFKAKTPLRIAVSIFKRLKVEAFIYLPTYYLYLNIFCSDVQIKVMKFKTSPFNDLYTLYYKNSSRRPTNRFVKECSRSWPDFLSPVKLYFAIATIENCCGIFWGRRGDRSRLLNSPPNWRSSINLTTS